MSDAELDMPDGRVATARMISSGTAQLSAAGVFSARNDAELLAAHVLHVPRGRLLTAGPFDAVAATRYRELIDARARRVPLQYLTGSAPFRHVDVTVGPGVFIPRPETELLVDIALGVPGVLGGRAGHQSTVVDLCSGSGAIALAVADELPAVRVFAVERDPAALRWLRRNVRRRTASGARVTVVEADVTDPGLVSMVERRSRRPVAESTADGWPPAAGSVDAVLCNPPYVPDSTPVAAEVDADPAVAVFGGPDGLAVIRPVVPLAGALLRPGGLFAVEHDEAHQNAVLDLVGADGRFEAATGHLDLAGRPRFVSARRRS